MKKLILLFFTFVYSFALTPYSLENVKEVNLKFLNKKENISKKLEEKITKKVKEELEKLGIQTKTEKYSNFIIKAKVLKIANKQLVQTSIMIVEDIKPIRDESLLTIAITYKKDDNFIAENLELDIYESIVDYLLEDFIEQYKAEN